MKKRLCALALALLMVFALCPTLVLALEELPEGNIAAKEYAEDNVIWSATEGNSGSPSSSSANRWNYSQNKAAQSSVQDPTDSANLAEWMIGAANQTMTLRKQNGFGTGDAAKGYVFALSMMISPYDGALPDKVTVTMLGHVIMTFTHSSGSEYNYSFFDGTETGTVQTNGWMRMVFIITPDGSIVTSRMRVQLTGDFTDGTQASVPAYDKTYTSVNAIGSNSNSFLLNINAGSSNSGVMIDDLYFYTVGRLPDPADPLYNLSAPAALDVEGYNDPGKNVKLNGRVSVSFYRDLDYATADFDAWTLTTLEGVPVECQKTVSTKRIIFDFSEHPLDVYTTYVITFNEGLRDIAGMSLHDYILTFATKGTQGSRPQPLPVENVDVSTFVMPDRYNTGYRCEEKDLVDFRTKYPAFTSGDVIISESLARQYGYEFCGFLLEGARIYVTATSPVYLHDFKVVNSGISNGKSGTKTASSRLTVAWGEGEGSKGDFFGGKNMTITHCYIHDVGADHMKGNSGQIITFNYFRDGGTRTPGAHADVIQFMGSSDEIGNNILVIGNRFDAPQMGYDHVANCCFFFKPEKNSQGYINVQAIGNWFNGGGYTTYLTPACTTDKCTYITYTDNKWGYGHAFGPLNTNDWASNCKDPASVQSTIERNGYMTTLQAGSVLLRGETADGAVLLTAGGDADLTGLSVTVNFANYIPDEHTYRTELTVRDSEGGIVSAFASEGSVRRYTPYKEYWVPGNYHDTGLKNPENGSTIYQLNEDPNLPHDVEETFSVYDLALSEGVYTLEVTVYDTTGNTETVIRRETVGDLTLTAKADLSRAFSAAVSTASVVKTLSDRREALLRADALWNDLEDKTSSSAIEAHDTFEVLLQAYIKDVETANAQITANADWIFGK